MVWAEEFRDRVRYIGRLVPLQQQLSMITRLEGEQPNLFFFRLYVLDLVRRRRIRACHTSEFKVDEIRLRQN